ncbi:Zinc finger protein [Smittium culicis]|uniref:Zinc finger protein n=1 Tax=Smittium culicis TaxID=133412 RepID=A0A1R1XSL5_9FUNG|nr:Zinc finger protein [Smittium culicis]
MNSKKIKKFGKISKNCKENAVNLNKGSKKAKNIRSDAINKKERELKYVDGENRTLENRLEYFNESNEERECIKKADYRFGNNVCKSFNDVGKRNSYYNELDIYDLEKGGPELNEYGSKTRKYICMYCFKRFNRPSSLKTHTFVHTGEKPYKCSLFGCGKSFSVLSNLRRHYKVHLNERKMKKLSVKQKGLLLEAIGNGTLLDIVEKNRSAANFVIQYYNSPTLQQYPEFVEVASLIIKNKYNIKKDYDVDTYSEYEKNEFGSNEKFDEYRYDDIQPENFNQNDNIKSITEATDFKGKSSCISSYQNFIEYNPTQKNLFGYTEPNPDAFEINKSQYQHIHNSGNNNIFNTDTSYTTGLNIFEPFQEIISRNDRNLMYFPDGSSKIGNPKLKTESNFGINNNIPPLSSFNNVIFDNLNQKRSYTMDSFKPHKKACLDFSGFVGKGDFTNESDSDDDDGSNTPLKLQVIQNDLSKIISKSNGC